MFLAVGALLHQLETFNKSPATRRNITLIILGVLIPVSWYHCWANEKYLHQITFAGMVFLCGRKTRQLVRERIPSEDQRNRLLNLANGGLGEFTHLHLPMNEANKWQGLDYSGTFYGKLMRISATRLQL